MGWTPINKISIERVFETMRLIVVSWDDEFLGQQEKRFPFTDAAEAIKFAQDQFTILCM